MENKNKKILFIVQYPENISPGQRFRFELYKNELEKNGYKIAIAPFFGNNGYEIIHKQGLYFTKLWAVLKGGAGRLLLLLDIKKYDFVFLQREAAPLGPPFFEWLYIKVFKKKLIYDFDDAIWVPQISENNSFALALKNVSKVKMICKWAYKVSCGNEYLSSYARKYNSNVIYNPTCVDTENRHNIICNHNVDRITIGWTGSFSTLKYLYILTPVLKRLQDHYDFDLKIICNQKPELDLKNIKYIQWTPENEVVELATCQIGLMPLTNDEWSEGKCGFKLIQYLSLEIPAVSSAVGVNKLIIEDGINGFLCNTEEEWYNAIVKMMKDAELRKSMGREGRKKIIRHYSLQSNKNNFLSIFS
jgi:glycosyltransferase involved in cell wall biosynthesis